LITLAVASFLAIGAFAVAADTSAEITADGFEWHEDDGVVTIDRYTGSETEVIIPSEIEGKTVKTIGANAFNGNKSIISVTIPNSVMVLGHSAFMGCSSLASVKIGDNVANISANAFNGCSSLASIVIPDGIGYIESSAFQFCTSLKSIVIPGSVTDIQGSAFGQSGLSSIRFLGNVPEVGTMWAPTGVCVYYYGSCTGWSEGWNGKTTYEITDTDLSGADISEIPDQPYTGSAVTPEPVVTLDTVTLVKDIDYKIDYEDNTGVPIFDTLSKNGDLP